MPFINEKQIVRYLNFCMWWASEFMPHNLFMNSSLRLLICPLHNMQKSYGTFRLWRIVVVGFFCLVNWVDLNETGAERMWRRTTEMSATMRETRTNLLIVLEILIISIHIRRKPKHCAPTQLDKRDCVTFEPWIDASISHCQWIPIHLFICFCSVLTKHSLNRAAKSKRHKHFFCFK